VAYSYEVLCGNLMTRSKKQTHIENPMNNIILDVYDASIVIGYGW